MTATTSLEPQVMDFSGLEDKMDTASSPFAHVEEVEDLDFEFDQMDNPPPDPASDNMMDDATEPGDARDKNADSGDVEFFEDESAKEGADQGVSNEFAIDEAAQENTQQDDEEILYEEEEDSGVTINKNEDEKQEYLDNPEQFTEDILAPDEAQDPVPIEAINTLATSTGQPADTNLDGDQSNNAFKAPQGNGRKATQENETTRDDDDGDGPSVNPTATEYEEDPDSNQPAQATEADLKVEESFEEVFDEEEGISVFPQDHNADYSAPLPDSGTIQEEELVKENGLHGDSLVSQEDFHSVRVVYQGVEYSLFPPKGDDSSSYFLPDSGLATQPLDALLASCRRVLGKPEDLDHHDELVLDVPTMGLHICEDSKYASQIKLSDVVEVYLSLNRNEDRDTIEPLYCSLSTRVCLSTQFDWLRDQAKGGSTFSDIAAQHADTPMNEDEDTDSAPVQEDLFQDLDHTDGTAALDTDPDSAAIGHAAQGGSQDDHALQSGPEYSADALPSATTGVERLTAQNTVYSGEESQLEPENVQSNDSGPEASLGQAANAGLDQDVDQHNAEADVAAVEPDAGADAEVSEFFQEAIDEQMEEAEEEIQEAAEDHSVLQNAIAEEQAEGQSLLADEAAQDEAAEIQDPYDADEFLINSDDEVSGEPDTDLEDGAAVEVYGTSAPGVNGKHANGDQLTIEGSGASAVAPKTPSKKTSKRKVSDEEDDFVLELDTPEPKRRRPS